MIYEHKLNVNTLFINLLMIIDNITKSLATRVGPRDFRPVRADNGRQTHNNIILIIRLLVLLQYSRVMSRVILLPRRSEDFGERGGHQRDLNNEQRDSQKHNVTMFLSFVISEGRE